MVYSLVMSLFILNLFTFSTGWLLQPWKVAYKRSQLYRTDQFRSLAHQTEKEKEVNNFSEMMESPENINESKVDLTLKQTEFPTDNNTVPTDMEQIPVNTTTLSIDPLQEAIKETEKKLQLELESLESSLRVKRVSLNQAKNRLMESGPRGYYLIQAQVNDFLRSKAADEAKLVETNKKEFVRKILPLIDRFRQVPSDLPATTKEETTIHENYKLILLGLELAVKKFGYNEYIPNPGDKLDGHYHQVIGLEEADDSGLIVRCEKSGWNFVESNEVIRKAQVVVTKLRVPSEETKDKKENDGKTANQSIPENSSSSTFAQENQDATISDNVIEGEDKEITETESQEIKE